MSFCPQCGREQRCGCSECHFCGVALVEKPKNSALPPPARLAAPARAGRHAGGDGVLFVGHEDAAEPVRVHWLAHVFLILGLGLLTIIVIETANIASHFPEIGPFSTASEGLGRAGYYFGILLYTNSARLLTGFALLAGGVLTGRATSPDRWDRAVRATGLVMGGLSIAYLVTCVLLILPFGSPPYALRVLLPPLWASIPILLVAGLSLLGAGFLMASRLSRQRKGLSLRKGARVEDAGAGTAGARATGPRKPGPAGMSSVPVKSSGAEHGGGAAD